MAVMKKGQLHQCGPTRFSQERSRSRLNFSRNTAVGLWREMSPSFKSFLQRAPRELRRTGVDKRVRVQWEKAQRRFSEKNLRKALKHLPPSPPVFHPHQPTKLKKPR